MDARRASIKLTYKGKNITDDIQSDLLSFAFNDNASGSADDISISLKDDQGKWINNWAPTKGDIIKLTIYTTNWNGDGDSGSKSCGTFIVDEPSYSGRPRVLNLGAVSTPVGFMDIDHSYTWHNATITAIMQKIIKPYADVTLNYKSEVNPKLSFAEQSKQTDSAFLLDLCQKNGLAMKLYNDQIVIFDEKTMEAKDSVATFTESNFISWTAKTSFTETGYDGCKISYTPPNTGTAYNYTYKPSTKTGSKIYEMNETADSLAEAQRYAKAKLRELNKKEYEISFQIPGRLDLCAADVIAIKNLGIFNGKYYIDKIGYAVGNGFTCTIDAHKCLSGY